jgi:hypothetical protein
MPGTIRFILGLVMVMFAAGADDNAAIGMILLLAATGIMVMKSGVDAMNDNEDRIISKKRGYF